MLRVLHAYLLRHTHENQYFYNGEFPEPPLIRIVNFTTPKAVIHVSTSLPVN